MENYAIETSCIDSLSAATVAKHDSAKEADFRTRGEWMIRCESNEVSDERQ